MSENKTVKYHIPEQGIYLYARTSDEVNFTQNLTIPANRSLIIEF